MTASLRGRVHRSALSTLVLLAALTVALTAPGASALRQTEAPKVTVVLAPYGDGWVDVIIRAKLPEEAFVVLPLLGDPDAVLVTNGDGVPLSYTIGDGAVVVEAMGEREVVVSYQTPDLVKRVGGVWELLVDVPTASRLEVRLPADAVIVGLSPVPAEVERGSNALTITFDSGTANVTYALANFQEGGSAQLAANPSGSQAVEGPLQGASPYAVVGLAAAVAIVALLAAGRRG